ncbi:MAG: Ppx/GppA phosphatase family protein [Acidimicrobiales bacterium]
MPGTVAAIDCGTNSTRLLITDGAATTLDRQMHVTRLGEGVDATGRLSTPGIERTLAVLRRYRQRMDEAGVGALRVVATSAARDAANASEFFDAAEEVLGVRPELLSGEEEAQLSFAGVTASLPDDLRGNQILVVDIGGGSTELVVGGIERPVGVSLDIGCVRLTERFLHTDPPSEEELVEADRLVRSELATARGQLPPLASPGWLVGLAGTVSTVAGVSRGIREYDREAVHHVVLTAEDVQHWLVVLAGETSAARRGRSEMMEGRADVIVGGVIVLGAVMDVFDCSRCLVSEDDILDGIAASVAQRAEGESPSKA